MNVSSDIHQAATDREQVVAKTLAAARRLLRADRCTLFLIDAATDQLYSWIIDEDCKKDDSEGTASPRMDSVQVTDVTTAKIVIDSKQGIAGKAFATKETINCGNTEQDPQFNPGVDEITNYRTKSLLCVPILSSTGDSLGVLQMVNKLDRDKMPVPFTNEDEKLMRSFVAQVAVAIINSQLFINVLHCLSNSQGVLCNLPEVVLGIANDGSFLECNRSLETIFGLAVGALTAGKAHYSQWLAGAPSIIMEAINEGFKSRKESHTTFQRPLLIEGKEYTSLGICPANTAQKGRQTNSALGMVVMLGYKKEGEAYATIDSIPQRLSTLSGISDMLSENPILEDSISEDNEKVADVVVP